MDNAFALDVSGLWHAICPREGGQRVFFRLHLVCDGGNISGTGVQLYDEQQWNLTVEGAVKGDKVELRLSCGDSDAESWVGEIEGTQMKLCYERGEWKSQKFMLRRGPGNPDTAASPAKGRAPEQKSIVREILGGGGSKSSSNSSMCTIS